MDKLYYSGIGSRETPEHILEDMYYLGIYLSNCGYVLRSGNARGADTAFSKGCDAVMGDSEIYLPYDNFNNGCRNSILVTNKKIIKQAIDIMKTCKSSSYTWNNRNTPYHSRNVFQVLGHNLMTKSSLVICYTDTGAESKEDVIMRNDCSGTSTAITLASMLNIPVINMYNKNWLHKIESIIGT